MTREEIKRLLEQDSLRPLKSLGQNFLCEPSLARFIVNALEAPEGADVLEVGPGLGSLTLPLLEKGYAVTAIELDKGLGDNLEKRLGPNPNFTLVRGDALKLYQSRLPVDYFAGNLPYNISTPLIAELLQQEHLPKTMVIVLQWETGQRFAAEMNTKNYGAITVLLQACYEVENLRKVGPTVFHPEPNVDSVIFRAKRHEDLRLTFDQRQTFYATLRKAFTQRRKKLRNTIGIDSDLRPEHLSVQEWVRLFTDS